MKGTDHLSFEVYLEPVDGSMLHHVIVVPDKFSGDLISEKGPVRILCKIGTGSEFPCALIPRHNRYVIAASKKLIKENNLLNGKPFLISIRPDPNNGLELPEELIEVLAQDDFAFQVFNALKDGEKRGYIYYIRQGKSIETRIKRSFEIAEKIKQRNRKL